MAKSKRGFLIFLSLVLFLSFVNFAFAGNRLIYYSSDDLNLVFYTYWYSGTGYYLVSPLLKNNSNQDLNISYVYFALLENTDHWCWVYNETRCWYFGNISSLNNGIYQVEIKDSNLNTIRTKSVYVERLYTEMKRVNTSGNYYRDLTFGWYRFYLNETLAPNKFIYASFIKTPFIYGYTGNRHEQWLMSFPDAFNNNNIDVLHYSGYYTNTWNADYKGQVMIFAPDNPIISNISPNNISYGYNRLSEVFTSSSPLTFYLENTQEFILRFYIKDDTHQDFDYQFSITPPMSFAQSVNLIKINFRDRIINVGGASFSFTFPDNAYHGNTILKIEAEDLSNHLKGAGYAYYEFLPLPTITNESLGLFIYNALNNQLRLFFDFGAPSGNPNNPHLLDFNNITFDVESQGLDGISNYNLTFAVFEYTTTTEGFERQNLIFKDDINYRRDFVYKKILTLNKDKNYEIIYWLWKNGVLVYDRYAYIRITNETGYITPETPSYSYSQFYASIIPKFGLSSTTTPTPAFTTLASNIDKIFNPLLTSLSFRFDKINNAKDDIIKTFNNIISYVNGLNALFPLSYFLVGIFFFVFLRIIIQAFKTIKPF